MPFLLRFANSASWSINYNSSSRFAQQNLQYHASKRVSCCCNCLHWIINYWRSVNVWKSANRLFHPPVAMCLYLFNPMSSLIHVSLENWKPRFNLQLCMLYAQRRPKTFKYRQLPLCSVSESPKVFEPLVHEAQPSAILHGSGEGNMSEQQFWLPFQVDPPSGSFWLCSWSLREVRTGTRQLTKAKLCYIPWCGKSYRQPAAVLIMASFCSSWSQVTLVVLLLIDMNVHQVLKLLPVGCFLSTHSTEFLRFKRSLSFACNLTALQIWFSSLGIEHCERGAKKTDGILQHVDSLLPMVSPRICSRSFAAPRHTFLTSQVFTVSNEWR